MEQSLKMIRTKAKLTQAQAAEYLKVSLRSYKSYENDPTKMDTIKYNYMLQCLEQLALVDESHGVLSRDDIERTCSPILSEYNISYCYLFGSYAKGTATEISDVDLLVSSEVKGIKFYGFVERLRTALHKNVDVLSKDQLVDNPELLDEILREGIKIYG